MTSSLSPSFRNRITPLCQSPLFAGLILHLVLSAPMSRREVEQVYTASMLKEVTVMESVKRTNTLNFDVFFGYSSMPLLDFLPPNEAMAKRIQGFIDSWIEETKKHILYPKVGSKTVSKVTGSMLKSTFPDYSQASDIGYTPIDLERVYEQFGIKIGGPCEMRQKWYPANLQPRTYYTTGGDAYHSSKYLADPLTNLCNILPATNRYLRVEPGRIVIRDCSDDVIYYDLSSFTSNLHVHYEFMVRLSQYCHGEIVEVLDARQGIVNRDLGDLILEYADTNLRNPTYTLPSKYGDPSVVHYHGIAGFLGVYGNIASATFIHGVVMTMMHEHLDENNVAGDDGLDVSPDVNLTLRVIRSLGSVVDEKTFRDSEGCCIHLKRPIHRIGNRLLHGMLSTWPSLEPLLQVTDPRYPYYQGLSNREKKDIVASSITAFLQKLESLHLTDDDRDLVDAHLSHMYDTYKLPRGGCVPQATRTRSAFIPAYEKRYIGIDPIHNTISRNYSGIATLPLRGHERWNPGMLQVDTFQCNTTKMLNYLEVLGYVEREKVSKLVYGHEGLQQLLKEYVDPEPPIYTFNVIHKLPTWVGDVNLMP